MTRIIQFIVISLTGIFFCSCINNPEEDEKYKRPDWLAGKVYTQIKEEPDLSIFAKCVELTGYDTIINKSGSYTVFAPNNEAFSIYFQNHPDYNSVEDIPVTELTKIVKYHIVQNPWSKIQLRSLDVFGWIDTLDLENNQPRGYKRETLLLEKDHFLGVVKNKNQTGSIFVIDSLDANWYRKVSVDSRKFAPIFYKEYFDIYDLSLNDYEFYFGRPFENPGDIYYVNGRIIGDEIFAENGFVYNIDRVAEPLLNAYQILDDREDEQSYTIFLNLINLFPEFTYNDQKTMDQPGADLGFEVDSLFDLTYPELTFNIYNEKTRAPSGTMGLPGNVTIRYHHGLIAPTDAALNELISEYLAGPNKWGSLKDAPINIKKIIANTHMCVNPIYPTDFEKGFYNGEMDIVTFDQANIVQKQYSSNSTFIGVNKAIIPRAFKSVTGPVYLQRGYSKVMYAIEQSGLLSALKRENENYLFYVESDANTRADSSLVYNPTTQQFSTFLIAPPAPPREYRLAEDDLRTLLLNHIGTGYPRGIAKKEFIKNLAGNYLIINNETGEVTGTAPTTNGYRGTVQVTNYPTQISTDADNGITYDVDDWFNFTVTTLFLRLSTSYPAFHNLLKKAGLSLDREYRYSFISDNEYYTVFVPNSAALNNYRADTIGTNNINDLRNFLLLHFVQGDLIFTDGNKPSGYYETTRVDEKSTPYSIINTEIYINPGYDMISLPGKTGDNYVTVNVSSSTNILTGRNLGTGTETYPNIVNTAVIHEIDTVLLFTGLDTR
jgi:uncharacterized surface protein with fasciclin (FAS1) repeats